MSAVIKEKTIRGLREIATLGFFTLALFFLIAILTFSNEDAGWSHSGSLQSIKNACGIVGAWLADLLLSIFGLMAYLFPLMIGWYGYLFYRKDKPVSSGLILMMRGTGFVLTIIAGSAIFYLHVLRIHVELPGSTGGILGQEVGDILWIHLGNSGATLFLLMMFLAGITLFTGLSWMMVLEFVGRYTIFGYRILEKTLKAHILDRGKDTEQAKKTTFKKGAKNKPKQKIAPALETNEPEIVMDLEPDLAKNEPEIAMDLEPDLAKNKSEIVMDLEPDLKSDLELEPEAEKPSKLNFFAKKKIVEPEVIDSGSLDQGTLPPQTLLDQRTVNVKGYSKADLEEMSRQVESVLQDFNVVVEVVDVHPGPVITRFELKLAAGVKVSRVSGLSKDIARGLSVTSVRIVEVIEGKSVIGLEIPNQEREMVSLRELLESKGFDKSKSKLTLAMGKDISGIPVIADLVKMPHVLVAGTTGSGKSVAINTMIVSLLYKATVDDVRLIMIDPKMLELSVYNGIPHLLTPVVTDMKDAQNALRWAVAEMERRYKLMSKIGVRNLSGFNQAIKTSEKAGKPIRDPLFQPTEPLAEGDELPVLTTLPSIVIVIDELADMMMIVGKKVEELIARLAQKARAAGIHLILATQRPSVDVLTGLIKANVPTRISFQVSSRIDSRTILDQGGAEALLGNGDMLFLPSGTSIPIRAHGAFIDDHEVHKIVEFLKQTAPAHYLEEITQERSDTGEFIAEGGDNESDALYDEAVMFVTESRKASISSVQRRFKIGYNRAARIIEEMELAGVVSPAESNGSREVLAPAPVKA